MPYSYTDQSLQCYPPLLSHNLFCPPPLSYFLDEGLLVQTTWVLAQTITYSIEQVTAVDLVMVTSQLTLFLAYGILKQVTLKKLMFDI